MKKDNTTVILIVLIAVIVLAIAGIVVAVVLGTGGGSGTPAEAPTPEPTPYVDYSNKHIKITAKDTGYDVYSPLEGSDWGYRYGPSILLNDDGTMDAWFASPGSGIEFDWFTYRHSSDGGATWSNEVVVLTPSGGTLDELSVCDPAHMKIGDYYYLGYTSTIDATGGGLCNSTFVARSKDIKGPYEHWDGNGWSEASFPIVYFKGTGNSWGEGEPSFVVLDDVIYVYITFTGYDRTNKMIKYTKVYTADAKNENWPSTLEYKGCAREYSDGDIDGYTFKDADSMDVAYVEKYHKFVGICTNRRFGTESTIVYYESEDGINFTRISELNTNIIAGCHNCGIMKDASGHIKEGDKMLIGYAYAGGTGSKWGLWATRFVEIDITVTDDFDRSDEAGKPLDQGIVLSQKPENPWMINFMTSTRAYYKTVNSSPFKLNSYAFDNTYKKNIIKDMNNMQFSDYDENVIKIDGGTVTVVGEGTTYVTIKYNGFTSKSKIVVSPAGATEKMPHPKIVKAIPTAAEYNVSLNGLQEAFQTRMLAYFENGTFSELYNRAGVNYKVEVNVADPSVCTVGNDCIIIPKKVGTTTATVSCEGTSYQININVTE